MQKLSDTQRASLEQQVPTLCVHTLISHITFNQPCWVNEPGYIARLSLTNAGGAEAASSGQLSAAQGHGGDESMIAQQWANGKMAA